MATNFITIFTRTNLAYFAGVGLITVGLGAYHFYSVDNLNKQKTHLETALQSELKQTKDELALLQGKDFVVLNQKHEEELANLQKLYNRSNYVYEKIQEFEDRKIDISKHLELFAKALKQISDKDYSGADTILQEVEKLIKEQLDKDESERVAKEKAEAAKKAAEAAAAAAKSASSVVNNAPAGSGYSSQTVESNGTKFSVNYIAADLTTTKVVVDTASDGDCTSDCPVLPLIDYVNRNSAFAGVNGTYFCVAAYPECVGKTNSFDPILMNRNKTYINWTNKLYNIYPIMHFYNGSARLTSRAVDMTGQDTSADAAFSNFPLLLSNGNLAFYGNNDAKMNSKGARGFLASKGSNVYIGFVLNATVTESARVMHTMGMTHAINLDSGGSTALWSGGYKLGPGRALPNAILFVKR